MMGDMEVWALINGTLGAVLWPAILVVALLLFRGEIADLIRRIRKLSTPFVEAETDPRATADQLTEDIRDDLPHLVRVQSHDESAASVSDEAGVSGSAEVEPVSPDGEDERRHAIEEIIASSVRAGWDVRGSGRYAEAPTPIIEWLEDGSPRILDWRGKLAPQPVPASRPATDPRREQVRRLEDEIRALKIEVNSMGALAGGIRGTFARDRLITELQAKLRQLDPFSPWVE